MPPTLGGGEAALGVGVGVFSPGVGQAGGGLRGGGWRGAGLASSEMAGLPQAWFLPPLLQMCVPDCPTPPTVCCAASP